MRSCHGHGAMMTREGPFTAACDSRAEAPLGSEHESTFLNADFHVREGSTRALLSDQPRVQFRCRWRRFGGRIRDDRLIGVATLRVNVAHPPCVPVGAPRRSSRCRIVSDGAVPAGTRRGRFLTFPGRAIGARPSRDAIVLWTPAKIDYAALKVFANPRTRYLARGYHFWGIDLLVRPDYKIRMVLNYSGNGRGSATGSPLHHLGRRRLP